MKLFKNKNLLKGLKRNYRWSVEKEPHIYTTHPDQIIREGEINDLIQSTKEAAKDPKRVSEILKNARDRALLKSKDTIHIPQAEYVSFLFNSKVQGLNLEEAATLLNVDSNNKEIMNSLYTTALFIKEAIYGNRIVLFSPLYLSNYCIASCLYCGYRGSNKTMERKALTEEELKEEVIALQKLVNYFNKNRDTKD
jgi:2-iminoacetate synthase